MKFGKKSDTVSKTNLKVNLCLIKNIWELKIKSYKRKIKTNFHNGKIPKKAPVYLRISDIDWVSFKAK